MPFYCCLKISIQQNLPIDEIISKRRKPKVILCNCTEQNLFQHVRRTQSASKDSVPSAQPSLQFSWNLLCSFIPLSPFLSHPPIFLPTPHWVSCLGALTLQCLVLQAYWTSLCITLHCMRMRAEVRVWKRNSNGTIVHACAKWSCPSVDKNANSKANIIQGGTC